MRFALDATPLTVTSGGLPRYVSELSSALAATYPADDFLLLSDQSFEIVETPNLKKGNGPANALEKRWWLWGAEKACSRQKADLFHGTNFAIPYFARRPTILTILDLSPWMDPSWHNGADRVRKHTPRMIRWGSPTMLLTLTEAVRKQVIDYFHVAPDSVAAVHLAAPDCYRPTGARQQRYLQQPYFLFVGTLEPRKNIPLLLEAWRDVRRETAVDLILAGRRRSDFSPIPDEPGLHVLGEVSEARLPDLYSGAVALVYPSLYEGFGLPVLEAMQCGTCVISSRDPAIAEVAGNSAIATDSAASMTQAMKQLLSNPEMRSEYRERSLRRARDFSWARTARMTHDVYLEAIARFGRS
jgi:glycosyltransferase involved in cell wall biosynthesis